MSVFCSSFGFVICFREVAFTLIVCMSPMFFQDGRSAIGVLL